MYVDLYSSIGVCFSLQVHVGDFCGVIKSGVARERGKSNHRPKKMRTSPLQVECSSWFSFFESLQLNSHNWTFSTIPSLVPGINGSTHTEHEWYSSASAWPFVGYERGLNARDMVYRKLHEMARFIHMHPCVCVCVRLRHTHSAGMQFYQY